MKIAFILEHPQSTIYSGGRVHGWLVACGLTELGHLVTMFTHRMPPFFQSLQAHYDTPETRQLRSLEGIDVNGHDLVIGYPIRASSWALRSAQAAGIPCYNWVLDDEYLCKKYAPAVGNKMHYGPDHTRALAESDKLLSISEYAVPFIKKWTGNPNVIGLMGCVNSRVAASVQTETAWPDEFVAITRTSAHKRFDDLVYLSEKLGIAINVITSFGKDALLMRIKGLKDRITVFDAPNDAKKFLELQRAAALLLPSAYEGLGMPMMEALYCRVPVICYDYGVMREVCEDAALYASWSSPESLADKVSLFMTDRFVRADLEMAARRMSARYSFEAMCKRLHAVFGTGEMWADFARPVVRKVVEG